MVKRKMLIDVHDHGTAIDEKKLKVKCNYCGKVVSGFYRLKCHLGSLRGDVLPCELVPSNVKDLMITQLLEKKRKSLKKEVDQLSHPDVPSKRNWIPPKSEPENVPVMVSTSDEKQAQPVAAETSVQTYSTSEQHEVEAVPVAMESSVQVYNTSEQYHEVEQVLEHTRDRQNDEMDQIEEYVNRVRDSWAVTGCSIVIDEWNDDKGRHLVNFLVDSPEGTIYIGSFDLSSSVGNFSDLQKILQYVIEDVELKNVVQIIVADRVARMWPATRQIALEHTKLCWSFGASRHIGFMLDIIGMMKPFGETLRKAKTLTKFIHGHADVLTLFRSYSQGHDLVAKSYKVRSLKPLFTLSNIVAQKNNLEDMFASFEWSNSTWASTTQGKWVADLMRSDATFWTAASVLLAVTKPLVQILDPMDGIDKFQVGFVYYSIRQAKERIKNKVGKMAGFYMPIWKRIDYVWDCYIHRPVHGAGYYLNPILFFTNKVHVSGVVKSGLEACIRDMVEDPHVRVLIFQQLEEYKKLKDTFKDGRSAFQGGEDVYPIKWWCRCGSQWPELQKFAIRILSQTSDGSSRYDLRRSIVEELLSTNQGINPKEYVRLQKLAFIEYHMKLQNTKMKAVSEMYVSSEGVDGMDDWSVADAAE